MAARSSLWTRLRVPLGYPIALLYLWLARPTLSSLGIGAAFVLLGLFIRALAAGRLRKHEQLSTDGIYALTRNPLYLGSAFLAAGFVIAGYSWIAALLVVAYALVFYPAVIRREELELRARYGPAFDDYARRTPRFFPRFAPGPTRLQFSWAIYIRNREYQAALGVLAGFALLALKIYLPYFR